MAFYIEGLIATSNEVIRIGEAASLDEAIAIAKSTIDEFLEREFKREMRSNELFAKYRDSGVIPHIFRDDGETLNVRTFNHLQYASAQCLKMCSR